MAHHPEVLGLRGSGKERGEGWGSVSAGVGTAGGPGSGLVPPGKGAALWLLGATTAEDGCLTITRHTSTRKYPPLYGPHRPLFSAPAQAGLKPWRGDSFINLG